MAIVKEFYRPGYIFELSGKMDTPSGAVELNAKSLDAGDGYRRLKLSAYRNAGLPDIQVELMFGRQCPEILTTAYSWVKGSAGIGHKIRECISML